MTRGSKTQEPQSLLSPAITPTASKDVTPGNLTVTSPLKQNRLANENRYRTYGQEYRLRIGDTKTLFKGPVSFYGATSYAAVFSENRSRFIPDLLDVGEEIEQVSRFATTGPRFKNNTKLWRKTLRMFPDQRTCERLLDTFNSFSGVSLPEPLIRHGVTEFWATFGTFMSEPRDDEKMDEIIKVLDENAFVPLQPRCDNQAESWPKWCAGPNLRWEMLGIIYTFFGIAFMSLQDWDPLFMSMGIEDDNRTKAAYRMDRCVCSCIRFCEISDTMNDLVVCLMLNKIVLESVCFGDES